MEVQFVRLVGQVDDGIIQPGEKINGVFTLTNIGGVPSKVEVLLTGNVENAKVTKLTDIKRLSSSEWRTGFIAQIDPRLQPRDEAEVTIVINGKIKDSIKQTVNRLVEITDQEVNINVLDGSGEIILQAKNLTTSGTKGRVSGQLNIAGQTINADIGNLGAGQSKRIVLKFSDVDPLLILKGELKAEVAVLHQQEQMEQRTLDIVSEDPLGDLVTYFDQLANGKGKTSGRGVNQTV